MGKSHNGKYKLKKKIEQYMQHDPIFVKKKKRSDTYTLKSPERKNQNINNR